MKKLLLIVFACASLSVAQVPNRGGTKTDSVKGLTNPGAVMIFDGSTVRINRGGFVVGGGAVLGTSEGGDIYTTFIQWGDTTNKVASQAWTLDRIEGNQFGWKVNGGSTAIDSLNFVNGWGINWLRSGYMALAKADSTVLATKNLVDQTADDIRADSVKYAFVDKENTFSQEQSFDGGIHMTDFEINGGHSAHIEDLINYSAIAGIIDSGYISGGNGKFIVSKGTAAIRVDSVNTAQIKLFNFAALDSTVVADGAVAYVGIKYNSGNPIIEVRALDNWNYYDNFPIGTVANVEGEIHVNQNPRRYPDQTGRLIRRFYGTRPYERDERIGGLILGVTGTRYVTLTAGRLWDRSNNFDISAINTSSGGEFDIYYRNASTGFHMVHSATQWPNDKYDDGSGTLATLGANKYANLWFYIFTDGHLAMLYGRAQYNNSADAQAGPVPATVPAHVTGGGRLLGRMVFKQGATTPVSIDVVWTSTLTTTGATLHNNLGGLDGGTAGAYFHGSSIFGTEAYADSTQRLAAIALRRLISDTTALTGTPTINRFLDSLADVRASMNSIGGSTLDTARIAFLDKANIFRSTVALESAPLGSELLSTSNWTTTGWTGTDPAVGFTHTPGNTTSLTNTLAAVQNNLYQIAYTVSGRTAGTFTITFGGESQGDIYTTDAWGPKASSTGTLSITPTSDFDGVITISIKIITGGYDATYTIKDNSNAATYEIRSSAASKFNMFQGLGAGRSNTTGSYNSASGIGSLYNNTTGIYNSAQGTNTLYSNTVGSYNSAQGSNVMYYNTTGRYNAAQGFYAMLNNTTGSFNAAQGANTLYNNSTGSYNNAQGAYALYSNTTGSYNSAQGVSALYANTIGTGNSAQGFYALLLNTEGNNNSAVGSYTLFNNIVGSNNSGLGSNVLYTNIGSNNTAQGAYAFYYNVGGSNNSGIGVSAGRWLANGETGRTTGDNGLYLGADTKASADGTSNEIVIGYNAVGLGSNTVVLGNSNITRTKLTGTVEMSGRATATDFVASDSIVAVTGTFSGAITALNLKSMSASDSTWWWRKSDSASAPGVPTINRFLDSLADVQSRIAALKPATAVYSDSTVKADWAKVANKPYTFKNMSASDSTWWQKLIINIADTSKYAETDSSLFRKLRVGLTSASTMDSAKVSTDSLKFYVGGTGYSAYKNPPSSTGSVTTIVKSKSANETVTGTTTLQNDDHLSFPIGANETWSGTIHLLVKATWYYDEGGALNYAGGIRWSWTLPSGGTFDNGASYTEYNANTPVRVPIAMVPVSGTAAIVLNFQNGTTSYSTETVTINFRIVNSSTAGTAQFKWACYEAGAGNETMLYKSCILTATKE